MSWIQVPFDENEDANGRVKYMGVCYYCGRPNGRIYVDYKPPVHGLGDGSGNHKNARWCIKALRDCGAIIIPTEVAE